MTNTFYSPGDERAAKVRELFATIARRYDLINDVQSFGLHRVWKRRLLRLAGPVGLAAPVRDMASVAASGVAPGRDPGADTELSGGEYRRHDNPRAGVARRGRHGERA